MNSQRPERGSELLGGGIAIGAGAGVALGLVLMTVMDHPGFFAVGIAIGVSMGTAIGVALQERG